MQLRPACLGALTALLVLLASAPASQPVVFTQVASGFEFATDLQHAPGDPALYVTVQNGMVHVVENGAPRPTPLLDIRDRVDQLGELGLLGLAFDPLWPASPFLYVHYVRNSLGGASPFETVISRFEANPTTRTASPESEAILITSDQPTASHNAGALAFGVDGYLYVTLGDGGEPASAQQTDNLRGSVLRLDVRGAGLPLDCGAGRGTATVPSGNPLVDGPGGNCDEIYAYGLRNPWRLTLDALSGAMWLGDVGNGSWEEVDVLAAGANYGWPILEGSHCGGEPPCDPTGMSPPVWEYGRTEGQSITGGYVYRGTNLPALHGRYIYGDYVSGKVWAFNPGDGSNELLGTLAEWSTTSFGVDDAGELYALYWVGGIHRFDAVPVADGGTPDAGTLELRIVGPNPADSSTSLSALSGVAGPARVSLVDPVGREAAVLFDGYLEAGSRRLMPFDASGLAPGVYVARLTTARGEATARIVISR